MAEQAAIIQAAGLCRFFQMGQEQVRALDNVSFTVQPGEFVGITGPSGSGKSTLLYLIGGLDHPTTGEIAVHGQKINALDEDALAAFRRETVGFIFQMFNLIPTMTALENVEFPLLFAGYSKQARRTRAAELLALVGLDGRMQHRPTELSGGQQQRVAIARALVHDPAVILADEPTGNLDSQSGSEVMVLLKTLNAQGRTIVTVSHDPAVIAQAGRTIRLHDGMIVADLPTPEGTEYEKTI